MLKKCLAEVFGTFWLVLVGCGTAVLAGQHVGFLGVSIAFGLSVVTMAYALGAVSGGHYNPAVSVGMVAAGRTDVKTAATYIVAQVIGGILAAYFIYVVAMGDASFNIAKGFATNGYGARSPSFYGAEACFLIEFVLTAFFILIIGGATSEKANKAFAPLAIGLALTAIHLISIPVTNTSVNPARSTGVALVEGGKALCQLWMFWAAPILGGLAGGLLVRVFDDKKAKSKK